MSKFIKKKKVKVKKHIHTKVCDDWCTARPIPKKIYIVGN